MKTVIIRQGYENCKSVFNEKLALDMIPEAKKPDQSKQIITFSLCSLRWTMGEIKWIIVFRHWTGNLKEPFWNGYADKGNKGLCGVFERVHRGFQFSEFKLLLRCQTSNEWAYISKVTWLFFFFFYPWACVSQPKMCMQRLICALHYSNGRQDCTVHLLQSVWYPQRKPEGKIGRAVSFGWQ